MRFNIRKPRSERYYQLKFDGFNVPGKNKIQRALFSIKIFVFSFAFYLFTKLKQLVTFLLKDIYGLYLLAVWIKNYITRKLIWSRGRLGRPVATFMLMAVAFVVFMFGEVFNSSKLVVKQEVAPSYLASATDIIPRKNIATTIIPESRRNQEVDYVVQEGDTLSSIGSKYKVSVDAIRYVNDLSDISYLKVGQKITIPPLAGIIHKVEDGDTLASIANKYDVPSQSIADFNYIIDTSTLAVGTELVIPGAKIPEPVRIVPAVPFPSTPSIGHNLAKGGYCVWPTTVNIISQYYAWYHNGVDIATPWSSGLPPLFACNGGVVVRSGWDPYGLGLHVRIDHGNGYETVYGHMSKLYVGYGVKVSKGQTLGLMGNTGNSTGPHVHFMIRFQGVPQNPMNFF